MIILPFGNFFILLPFIINIKSSMAENPQSLITEDDLKEPLKPEITS